MSQLFETIKIVDSLVKNLAYHQARVEKAFGDLYQGKKPLALDQLIKIPGEYSSGIVKCKVVYDGENHTVEFSHYTPRVVKSLKLVYSDTIDYDHKYTDRDEINELFAQREPHDDILIVKNGRITDTSIANIVFGNSSGWYTPDAPLLKGTTRERLIQSGTIKEKLITIDNLSAYTHFVLINAMLEFNPGNRLPVSAIYLPNP